MTYVNVTIHTTVSKKDQISNKIGAQNGILEIGECFDYVLPVRECVTNITFGSMSGKNLISMLLIELDP